MCQQERVPSRRMAMFLGFSAGLVQLFFWRTVVIFYGIPWLTGPLFRSITVEEVVELSRLSGAIERSALQMFWRDITIPVGAVSALLLGVGECLFLGEGRARRRLGRRFLAVTQAPASIGGVLCLVAIRVTWNLSETVFPLAPAFVLSLLLFIQLAVYYVKKKE